MPVYTGLSPETTWVGAPVRPRVLSVPRWGSPPGPGPPYCDVSGHYFLWLLPQDACGEYLTGAVGELQHAVDVLPGLVMVAHEPEEEAGIVQGSPAGLLADFLQAALELLNCFLVCESHRGGRG